MESTPVEVKRLSPNATLPTRATPNSAGLDLASAYDNVIAAKSKIIKTDLTIKIPKSCYGRIGPRSSLTLNYFIDVVVGVVGEDFTATSASFYLSSVMKVFYISKGDRVAQLIFEQIVIAPLVEVGDDSSSIRGDRGFGPSGIWSTAKEWYSGQFSQ